MHPFSFYFKSTIVFIFLSNEYFLGILSKGMEGSWFKKFQKLKMPCMPWYLIKCPLSFALLKERI